MRMVTGDNLLTARAIAIECGIVDPNNKNSLVMNGMDFIARIGGGNSIFKINLKSYAKIAGPRSVNVRWMRRVPNNRARRFIWL